jgi:mannosyl-3-phosphoglycerate phosphatase
MAAHRPDTGSGRKRKEAGMNAVIFTDLDASLLDQDGYDFSGAAPALREIIARRIPLIAVTSKCFGEIGPIQTRLGIGDPFIVENGAALYLPKGYRGFQLEGGIEQKGHMVFRWGLPYQRIRAALAEVRNQFPVRGFGDMTVAEVAQRTGLSLEIAAMARQREFTEPFILEDPARLREMMSWAASLELRIVQGGRFFHLMAAGQDKGRAVRYLTGIFRKNNRDPLVTIGIGDSLNDREMLAEVDVPVLMPHDDGTLVDIRLSGLIIGSLPGSRGWNEVVLRIINRIHG